MPDTLTYFRTVHGIHVSDNLKWPCRLGITVYLSSSLSSTLLVLNMTFDRFYSIIKPHIASSFNTVKRAKASILGVVLFSVAFNVPHIFIESVYGSQCVTLYGVRGEVHGQFYYWSTVIIQYFLPFILIIVMNSIIIHSLNKRLKWSIMASHQEKGQGKGREVGQGQGEGTSTATKEKASEIHVYVTLLLVSFTFLVLTTPACFFTFYVIFVDYTKTPFRYAGYYLYYHFGQKSLITNNSMNFFLYVISGRKFRQNLLRLFKVNQKELHGSLPQNNVTRVTTISAFRAAENAENY